MVARKRNARTVLVVAVIMFALIVAFFFWIAGGEANTIGSPVSTATTSGAPTELIATSSPTNQP